MRRRSMPCWYKRLGNPLTRKLLHPGKEVLGAAHKQQVCKRFDRVCRMRLCMTVCCCSLPPETGRRRKRS